MPRCAPTGRGPCCPPDSSANWSAGSVGRFCGFHTPAAPHCLNGDYTKHISPDIATLGNIPISHCAHRHFHSDRLAQLIFPANSGATDGISSSLRSDPACPHSSQREETECLLCSPSSISIRNMKLTQRHYASCCDGAADGDAFTDRTPRPFLCLQTPCYGRFGCSSVGRPPSDTFSQGVETQFHKH